MNSEFGMQNNEFTMRNFTLAGKLTLPPSSKYMSELLQNGSHINHMFNSLHQYHAMFEGPTVCVNNSDHQLEIELEIARNHVVSTGLQRG